MEELFVLVSETSVFVARHPQYTYFRNVRDRTGEVVGYMASRCRNTIKTSNKSIAITDTK